MQFVLSAAPIINLIVYAANCDTYQFYVSYSTSSRKPVNKPGQLSDVDVLAADAIEPGLVVAVVPPLHTLILNKYSTFPDHVSYTCQNANTSKLMSIYKCIPVGLVDHSPF